MDATRFTQLRAASRRSPNGCGGIRRAATSRRAFLQAGTIGTLGALPAARALAEQGQTQRSCIFLFMWGGPSQLDTFDMKPQAPDTVRGEFQPVATTTPGVQICEHFSQLASRMDRVALVRSLSHTDPAHLSGGHATLTGQDAPVLNSDADPPSPQDAPHLGSLISRLRPPAGQMPGSVVLPWKAYHPAAPGGVAPGQHGGWLGPGYDPLLLTGDPNTADWRPPALQLVDGVDNARLEQRRSLLNSLDEQRRRLDAARPSAEWSNLFGRACDLLLSPEVYAAFDLSQEPDAVRDRYGRNTHGQSVLLARRLVERGVPVVNVNWHNDNKAFWDTHGNNFNRLKQDLIPPADQALSALLDDLRDRGLIEQVVIAWVGEFGRKPQITAGNAGREHWPRCYSGLLAGGGIQAGAVYGSSDKLAEYPKEHPVTPHDYMATLLAAMGVDLHRTLPDREGRPRHVAGGQPIADLLS